MIKKFEACVAVDQICKIDQQISEKSPTDESMQQACTKAEAKHRLEKNCLGNEFTDPFRGKRPINFSLSARDVTGDTHHAAIGEIQRCNGCQCKQDLFDECEHDDLQTPPQPSPNPLDLGRVSRRDGRGIFSLAQNK